LDARYYVHSIAKHISFAHHYFCHVQAYSKINAPVSGSFRVAEIDVLLKEERALQSIDRARKCREH
jgi:hypothetical protein